MEDVIGPVFIVLLSAIAAVAVGMVLLRSHTPDVGYLTWIREAFSAAGQKQDADPSGLEPSRAALQDVPFDGGHGLHVADILAMSEQGPAYQEAVDLRRFTRRTRVTR